MLTYAGLVDYNFVARHKLKSIRGCLQETLFNLRDDIVKDALSKEVGVVEGARLRGGARPQGLSSVDFALLETCLSSSGAILVTDDSALAFEARKSKVKVFSTPELVEYLVKNRAEGKLAAIAFLQKLLPLYPRKNKVVSTLERIESY